MDMQKETLFSEVETANSKQLAVLKANFPQCFDKNGAFIQEKLLEIVKSSDVELSKESYSLNWLGKSYARLLANLPPKTLLTEDKDHNQREENKNSQNLLIKGDNLEVLKHMVNAYSEKVKMSSLVHLGEISKPLRYIEISCNASLTASYVLGISSLLKDAFF